MSYSYDSHGNRATMTYPNGKTVSYSYDEMNRLVSVKGVDGKTTRYSYDALGRRIATEGAKETSSYTYDEVGNLVSQTTTGAYDLALSYAYDLSGRMTSESRTENGATLTSSYVYDALGQLTGFTRSDGLSESYAYDPVGNMKAKTQNGVSTAMKYNAANQLVQSVTGNDTTKYAYDANGNLVRSENAGGARSYAYNALGLLSQFTGEDGYVEYYSYNANGLLSSITTSEDLTTALTWDILYGDGVVIGATQNGKTTSYTYGLERISAIAGNTRTEYVHDGRGSVAAEVSYNTAWYTFGGGLAKKNVTSKSYTPFGEKIGEATSGFGYNGEYYNAATGMIYLRARFYEPEMNRFSQKDLVRGSIVDGFSLNRYLYVQNDPVNFIDSNGRSLKSAWDAVKGAVVGAVTEAVAGAAIGAAAGGVVGGIVGAVVGGVAGGMAGAILSKPQTTQPANDPPATPSNANAAHNKTPTPYPTPTTMPIPEPKPGPPPVLPRNAVGANDSASRSTAPNRGGTYNENPASTPSVDSVTAAGACVLINKKVDNVGSIVGTQHTSALFQNADGDWYFFFWGNIVVFEKLDDNSAVENLDSLNSYLYNHDLYENPDKPYISSVYISGDFSSSIDEASRLLDVYEQSKRDAFMANADYNLISSNCTQVTMRLVELGLLPDGTTVGEYMDSNNIHISVWPTSNMKAMQQLFGNTATNYNDYLTQTGSD